MTKIKKLDNLDIFEKVFLSMIEYPSMRWNLKRMIDNQDKVDFAELDVKLRKLEYEISKKKGKEV